MRFSRLTAISLALTVSGIAFAQGTASKDDDLFPKAKPGECYAKVFVPPAYGTETKQMVKREAGTRLEVIPARYGDVTETVVVREAGKRLEVIPAVYETVTEQVLSREASKRIEVVAPAQYEETSEQVLVREAYTTWKAGRSNTYIKTGVKVLNEKAMATGDIMCLVEVPAEYQTVTKRVLKTPPQTREVEIPAEYRTVTRTVLKTPASTREIDVPEITKTVTVRKEVEKARTVETAIPAEYQTVSLTKQTSEGRYEWRSILCETNATPGKIKQIQTALHDKGFYDGPIDGIVASRTMAGVNAFQRASNLPVDPYINMDTVAKLGVSPK